MKGKEEWIWLREDGGGRTGRKRGRDTLVRMQYMREESILKKNYAKNMNEDKAIRRASNFYSSI